MWEAAAKVIANGALRPRRSRLAHPSLRRSPSPPALTEPADTPRLRPSSSPRPDPQMAGVARLAQVDCTMNMAVCQEQHVQGFPSMRVFRGGSDIITAGGHQDHASYAGDRTVESIVGFIRGILPQRPAAVLQALPAGSAAQLADLRAAKEAGLVTGGHHPGCIIDGFVLVKKVPGSLFVTAHSPSHSFEHGLMNMTHSVKAFFVGGSLSAQKIHELRRLMPGPVPANWMDKLAGARFVSDTVNTTHEHYLQVVRTTVVPLHVARGYGAHVDSFEYTVHSHSYQVEASQQKPTAKFSFTVSPMQVVIRVRQRLPLRINRLQPAQAVSRASVSSALRLTAGMCGCVVVSLAAGGRALERVPLLHDGQRHHRGSLHGCVHLRLGDAPRRALPAQNGPREAVLSSSGAGGGLDVVGVERGRRCLDRVR